jgi:hypothetical protein
MVPVLHSRLISQKPQFGSYNMTPTINVSDVLRKNVVISRNVILSGRQPVQACSNSTHDTDAVYMPTDTIELVPELTHINSQFRSIEEIGPTVGWTRVVSAACTAFRRQTPSFFK